MREPVSSSLKPNSFPPLNGEYNAAVEVDDQQQGLGEDPPGSGIRLQAINSRTPGRMNTLAQTPSDRLTPPEWLYNDRSIRRV
jgi:hypothetical protein